LRVPELPLRGGCLCGGARFEVSEPLVSANTCQCTRQRRGLGAGADRPRVAAVPSEAELPQEFRPTEGSGKVFCSRFDEAPPPGPEFAATIDSHRLSSLSPQRLSTPT